MLLFCMNSRVAPDYKMGRKTQILPKHDISSQRRLSQLQVKSCRAGSQQVSPTADFP